MSNSNGESYQDLQCNWNSLTSPLTLLSQNQEWTLKTHQIHTQRINTVTSLYQESRQKNVLRQNKNIIDWHESSNPEKMSIPLISPSFATKLHSVPPTTFMMEVPSVVSYLSADILCYTPTFSRITRRCGTNVMLIFGKDKGSTCMKT